MSPPENLTQLNRWITENVTSLTAALNAARTLQDAQQVEQSATRFLQILEAKDRAALTAMEPIRREIDAGRPYRQHHTTWTHRLAQLAQETAAHNQVHAVIYAQLTATRQMLAQLKQMQHPAVQPQDLDTPSTRSAASPQPQDLDTPLTRSVASPQPLEVRPTQTPFAKRLRGLSFILLFSLFSLGIIGALTDRSPGATTSKATATSRLVATVQATQAPTEGPATEAADLLPTRSTSPQAPATPHATSLPPAAPLPTAAPPPTITPVSIAAPAPTPTPATIANANANLRTGPGADYPIAGALTAGQAVKVIARNPAGDWYQIASGAWVYGALLNAAPVVPVAAVIPPASPPTSTPAPPTPVRAIVAPPAPPARVCCKICTSSKACGDTCIARNKTCNVGAGCACNG